MELANQICNQREHLNITQQELADQLFVTRQTVSRWETGKTIPNLDTLVSLSDILHLSLDDLLRKDGLKMVNKISKDVKEKNRYKNSLLIIGSIFLIFILYLGILSWGRYNQNDFINRTNPFLSYQYGYAVVPEKTPIKKGKVTYTDKNGNKKTRTGNFSQKVKANVITTPFGDGEWLTFSVGEIPEKGRNYAYVQYKGSYVRRATLIKYSDIPKLMRNTVGKKYIPYNEKYEKPQKSINPFR